jgi:bacterioferritin (cytochrome b1)
MGFDLERSETRREPAPSEIPALEEPPSGENGSNFSQALSRNLLAERFAIDAYRKIAENAGNCDRATLRLVRVALAVEEEHAEILSAIMENLRNLNGALAG